MNSTEQERPSQEEIQSAERTIKILEQRKRLRAIDQRRLDEARAVIERKQACIVKAAEAALQRKEQSIEIAQKERPPEREPADAERELQELIERVENGFLAFVGAARAKIQEHIADDRLITLLDIPFQIAELNLQNSQRNMLTFRRTNQPLPPEVEHPMFDVFELHQGNEFLYGIDDSRSVWRPSGYTFPERTLYLPRNIDTSSTLDMLSIYHELVHAGQDNAIRSLINDERTLTGYILFQMQQQGEREKTWIDNEWIAYAFELEVLNALADNQLRQLPTYCLKDLKILMQHLDLIRNEVERKTLPNSSKILLPVSIDLIPTYFPSGKAIAPLPKAFCDEISRIYQDKKQYKRPATESTEAFPVLASSNTAMSRRVCFVREGARL